MSKFERMGKSDYIRCPNCGCLLVAYSGQVQCGNCSFEDNVPDEWLPRHARGSQINHQHWEAEAERLQAEKERYSRDGEFCDPT